MKTTIALVALTAMGLLAAEPKGKVDPKLAGVYHGTIDDDKVVLTLNPDGTATAKPPDEDIRLKGKWRLAKPGVVVSLSHPDDPDKKAVVSFRIAGADLLLSKVLGPDGDVKTFDAPRFRQTKAGDKKFTGEYKGEYDEQKFRMVVKAGGALEIWPDDPNAPEPLHRGTWKAGKNGINCIIKTDDGDAKVNLRADGKDFVMVKLEEPDGEVKVLETRFKRVKKIKKQK